jgi:preprotein translocase SecE subunit
MSKDDAAWLNVAYMVFFAILAYVFYRVADTFGIQYGWVERYEWYSYLSVIFGLAGGSLSTFWLRQDSQRADFFLAAIAELRKVTWPSWPDTKRMTVIVCIVVGIFAVIVSIFDLIWARALKMLLA